MRQRACVVHGNGCGWGCVEIFVNILSRDALGCPRRSMRNTVQLHYSYSRMPWIHRPLYQRPRPQSRFLPVASAAKARHPVPIMYGQASSVGSFNPRDPFASIDQ